ncbi:unnamed protein product [Diatraea saccharalis]|uniref:Fibronectin type-III domain-containing protein n=1 Tax=Diatraea saccharalis TaxID=40085 RepID=A0A9N9RGI6_9NEOP|nr:unnamed protein product [Diatraea saccharalis]
MCRQESDASGESTMRAEYKVEGLRPATAYAMRVAAVNDVGESAYSDAVILQTMEEAPSEPPHNVEVQSTAPGELLVKWQAPPQESWNGELLGYLVTWREAGSMDTENTTQAITIAGWGATQVSFVYYLRPLMRAKSDQDLSTHNYVANSTMNSSILDATMKSLPMLDPDSSQIFELKREIEDLQNELNIANKEIENLNSENTNLKKIIEDKDRQIFLFTNLTKNPTLANKSKITNTPQCRSVPKFPKHLEFGRLTPLNQALHTPKIKTSSRFLPLSECQRRAYDKIVSPSVIRLQRIDLTTKEKLLMDGNDTCEDFLDASQHSRAAASEFPGSQLHHKQRILIVGDEQLRSLSIQLKKSTLADEDRQQYDILGIIKPQATCAQVGALQAAAHYEVRARAFNAVGAGPPSAPFTATILEGGKITFSINPSIDSFFLIFMATFQFPSTYPGYHLRLKF